LGRDFQYNCQNEPGNVKIPEGRLGDALKKLPPTTRCPISGSNQDRGKRSKLFVGMMMPEQAFQAMLDGTGLEGDPIRGDWKLPSLPQ